MYYQIFADHSVIPSKVFFDAGEPSIGRIRGDSVAPPHNLASLKRRISRVEEIPAIANADFFAGDDPLREGYISILGTDGPGLSEDEPMSIIQTPIVQVESPIPEGRYGIKSRAGDFLWNTDGKNPIEVIRFYCGSIHVQAKDVNDLQVWSILQLFKYSMDNSLFRSGTSRMILMVTSS